MTGHKFPRWWRLDLKGDSEREYVSTRKSGRMGWNIGGFQGQHDAGGYHTSPNKAVYLGAHPNACA